MLEKNQIHTIEITGAGEKGEGVGRIGGMTVFVPQALPGERAEILIVKVLKHYAFGKLLKLIDASPDRTVPACPAAGQCGGCDFQHCSYALEQRLKTQRVKDCLSRIGGLDVPVLPILGDGRAHYRNKAQFPVTPQGIGFYAARSHRVVPTSSCMLQHENANRAAALLEQFMKQYHIPAYDEQTGAGVVRHLYVRTTQAGHTMVCVVTAAARLPHADAWVERLRDAFGPQLSAVQNVNPKRTNTILGEQNNVLFGSETIIDTIGGMKFEISPHSFFQVNPAQTKVLYDQIVKLADFRPDDHLLDLYCGIGTIGLYAAKHVRRVTGVECVPAAVCNARRNAALNGIRHAEFYVGNAEDLAGRFAGCNVIVVDPPRKGCDPKLLQTIERLAPERLVYVSCNPATLARDLQVLSAGSFRAELAQPVDLFYRTAHVETIVLLQRETL